MKTNRGKNSWFLGLFPSFFFLLHLDFIPISLPPLPPHNIKSWPPSCLPERPSAGAPPSTPSPRSQCAGTRPKLVPDTNCTLHISPCRERGIRKRAMVAGLSITHHKLLTCLHLITRAQASVRQDPHCQPVNAHLLTCPLV